MKTYQCDKCGQALDLARYFNVGFPFGGHVDLCTKCAEPFMELVKKQGLLDDDFVRDWSEATNEAGSFFL